MIVPSVVGLALTLAAYCGWQEFLSALMGCVAVWLPQQISKKVAFARYIGNSSSVPAHIIVKQFYWAAVIKVVVFISLVVIFFKLPCWQVSGRWLFGYLAGCQILLWFGSLRWIC